MTVELRMEDVSVAIGAHTLVKDLSITAHSGQILGLVGPNGSGKTTALRCVYRALRPSAGTIRVGDADLAALSLRDSARKVAALTQENQSTFDFTVAEIVALGRAAHLRANQSLSPGDLAVCREAMEHLDVAHLADRGMLNLSGGERQRVLLARALAQRPGILVLDEPTNHLDIRHQVRLLGLLKSLRVTVLVVLHDLNLAAAACDRVAVLRQGRLVACGTPPEVLTPRLVSEVFGVEATVVTHPETGVAQLLYAIHPQPPGKEPIDARK